MCRSAHQNDAKNAPDGILTIHSKSEGAAQIGAMAKIGSTQKVGGAGFKLLCVARHLATVFCLTMVSAAHVPLRLRPWHVDVAVWASPSLSRLLACVQPSTYPWDTCGPQAILEAMGGSVVDPTTGVGLTYAVDNPDTHKVNLLSSLLHFPRLGPLLPTYAPTLEAPAAPSQPPPPSRRRRPNTSPTLTPASLPSPHSLAAPSCAGRTGWWRPSFPPWRERLSKSSMRSLLYSSTDVLARSACWGLPRCRRTPRPVPRQRAVNRHTVLRRVMGSCSLYIVLCILSSRGGV